MVADLRLIKGKAKVVKLEYKKVKGEKE